MAVAGVLRSPVGAPSLLVSSTRPGQMSPAAAARWFVFLVALGCLVGVLDASAGDVDPLYRSAVFSTGFFAVLLRLPVSPTCSPFGFDWRGD